MKNMTNEYVDYTPQILRYARATVPGVSFPVPHAREQRTWQGYQEITPEDRAKERELYEKFEKTEGYKTLKAILNSRKTPVSPGILIQGIPEDIETVVILVKFNEWKAKQAA